MHGGETQVRGQSRGHCTEAPRRYCWRGCPEVPFEQQSRHQIFAVEVKQVEQEEYEAAGTGVTGVLNRGERRRPVWSHTDQFTVEISAMDWQRTQRPGSARIFFCPVEAGAGEHCHPAAINFQSP
jgi:hypothetical protein